MGFVRAPFPNNILQRISSPDREYAFRNELLCADPVVLIERDAADDQWQCYRGSVAQLG